MKYFTPELYLRLQDFSSDEAMDAADAVWQRARSRYQRHVKRIISQVPRSLRSLLETYYLHDAEVLSMGREEHTFVTVLRLDTPPKELLVLNYQLVEEAIIHKTDFPFKDGRGPMKWMYDEIGMLRGKKPSTTQAILFNNGWEVQLRFRDLHVIPIQALYPVPGTLLVPVSSSVVPRPA